MPRTLVTLRMVKCRESPEPEDKRPRICIIIILSELRRSELKLLYVSVVRIMSNLRKVLKSKLSPQPKTLVNTEVDHDSSVTQVNEEEERCHDITEVIQGSWSHADEKAVYESQMTLLQEQLVAAMIEHQALASELNDYKENNKINNILKELETEQQKRQELEKELLKATRNSSRGDVSGDWVDVGHIASEEIPAEIKLNAETASSAWMNVLPERMVAALYELLADFTEEAVPEPQLTEDETLSVNRLKDNIRRFKSNSEPIFDSIQGVRSLLRWKNPAATFLTFVVYMYAVYIGWLLPVALFLLLFRLFVNYLSSKGWDLNVQYFRETERQKAKDGDSFSDMGVSDKFSVVVQVAKQVQNKLGHIADTLEKFKNLLMWKQPAASLNLFLVLLIAFIASCFLPGQTLFTVGGILLGIKLYIIEYIYVRFPRFKQRHDSVARMWRELPTDRELENRYQKAAINRNLVISRSEVTLPKEVSAPEHDFQFCEVFNLPPSETPKTDWVGGRRCTLIDKDKSWTSAIQYGRLFLTHSFLCFERLPVNKKSVSSNVMIALKDITSIVRSKPYWLLPGPGMSIDICVSGFEKPYVFGTILNRDETYANIVNHAKKVELPWAMDVATEAVATETDAPVDNTDGGAGLSFRMSTLKEKESGDEDEMGRNLDLLVDL